MKILHDRRRPGPPGVAKQRGFALIVTISLMVLVMIISVGMLSLSAIAMRTGTRASAKQEAMSNARLALLIAIGDLQRAAGPDQRISAQAHHVDQTAPGALTGIWRSHDASSREISADPESRFESWLVSHPDRGSLEDGTRAPAPSGRIAPLLAEGSLGTQSAAADRISASVIDLKTSNPGSASGGYAYAILDESTKARVDLDPLPSPYGDVGLQANLGEARRFGIEAIDEMASSGFQWWASSGQDRLISLDSTRLLDDALKTDQFSNDLTVWSRGLLTDAARGGLRRDLSLMFESLPRDYSRAKIYDDPGAARAPANPYWTQLQSYATLYKDLEPSSLGGYQAKATVPRGYRPYRESRGRAQATPAPPRDGYPLMPVVTKVQMQFSLVARNAHGGWPGRIRSATNDSNYRYMLHMMYSPVVTVYNPYNAPLAFEALKVSFADMPIGFQFFVNNRAQTTAPAPLNQLYVRNDSSSSKSKEFVMTLVESLESNSGGITLAPGESRIFGTPVSPDWSWAQDRPGDGNTMFDWRSNQTSEIKLARGWINEGGVGFDIDWLVPRPLKSGSAKMAGVLPLRSSDRVDVAFSPLPPAAATDNAFVTTIQLQTGRRNYPAGIIEMEYESATILEEYLTRRSEDNPLDPWADLKFPVQLEKPRRTSEIFEADSTLLKNYTRVLPFAVFSFRNKATLESGSAAKPGVCHSPVSQITDINAGDEDPAIHSIEASLLPVVNAGAGNSGAIEGDPDDRAYSFSGHSKLNGVTTMPLYELPALPLQSLAQLRHANLASSGHFPYFTYTVGESWANPMIPADRVVAPGDPHRYDYLDHTWLANTVLWDSYFFSTICNYSGPGFADGTAGSVGSVFSDFLDGTRPLINSRLAPNIPSGTDAASLGTQLAGDPESYRKSAGYMWVEGPFNINSLSVEAWKTVLSGLNKSEVPAYDPLSTSGSAGSNGEVESPLPRHRRPAGPAITAASTGILNRESRWRGFRTLNEGEIEGLAEEIVEQIKERGPFLSLSQFVNRNPDGDIERALVGPLQAAINESGINSIFDVDARDIPLAEVAKDGFAFPEAMAGTNADGVPGFLTQGDILSSLGSAVAVRSDTFRIRAYGEARRGNQVSARAWCEAVVQRTHGFIDPVDPPETAVDDLSSNSNKEFGRRFAIISFRWLSPEEV